LNNLAHQQAQNATDLLELVSREPVDVMLESIDREQAAADEVIQDGPFQIFKDRYLHPTESILDNPPIPF
jgi:hypothetical protein